jgi:hypothetical protein
MIGLGSVHVAVLHPPRLHNWLANARDRDLRLHLAAQVIELVSGADPGAIVVFPAAFLRATTLVGAHDHADQMLTLARREQVALVFGIQIGEDDEKWAALGAPPKIIGFACDGPRRLIWPSLRDPPIQELRGRRIGVLFGQELFRRHRRHKLVPEPPELILALTNLGPTGRWKKALGEVGTIAPTVVVGESTTGGVPAWAAAPNGWRADPLSSSESLTIVRYQPATPAAVLAGRVGGEAASMKD